MVIKLFKGQVKIADVKAAFDEIIEKVNTMITDYNNSSYIQDIDYSVAGSTLAPSGYTLTVGGMKQFMDSCDGSVVGGKPFKVDSNRFKMSTGLLVTKNGIYRLPDSVLDIPTDKQYRTVYYNTTTNEYQWTGEGTINKITTEEKTIGSRLYYGLENDPKAMLLRKEVYDSNIVGARTLSIIGVPEKSLNDCIAFFKNTAGTNTAESVANGSINIPLDMYAHVSGNFTKDDTLVLKLKDRAAANRNGVSMGTYNPDTGIYEPKLDIVFYTVNYYYLQVNINGCQKFGVDEEYQVPYYATAPIGNCKSHKVWETDEVFNYVYIQFKRNEFGILVAEVGFVNNDGVAISKREIQMPADIDSYNINTLIPRTWYMDDAVNSIADDPVKTYSREAWYADDCMILRKDGTEIGLSTESQTIAVNTVEVVESDSAAYRICDINPDTDTKLISNIKGVQNEKINGTYKITSESKWVKPVCGVDRKSSGFRGETPDTSNNSLFIWGQEAQSNTDEGGYGIPKLYLFGKMVQWNRKPAHRRLDWWSPLNMLFVPKGVENPYTYDEKYNDFTHWFKVNISKNIKDT